MKRGLGLLLISLLLLSLSSLFISVSAQSLDPSTAQNLSNSVNRVVSNPSGSSNYLANELTKMLLKNPTVAKINDTLQKVELFFVIVFGEPFSLTIRFLFAVIFTFYFFFFIKKPLVLIVPFNAIICWLIALLITLGASRSKVFGFLGGLVQSLILDVPWWAKILVVIVIIIAVKISDKTFGNFIDKIKMKKKLMDEEKKKDELDYSLKKAETVINPYVDALSNASGVKGDSVKISLKPLSNAVNKADNSNSSPAAPSANPSLEEDDGDRHRGGGGD